MKKNDICRVTIEGYTSQGLGVARLPEGVVFAPLHFAEAMVNLLTCTALDPVSKTPEYKIRVVRLERV